MVLILSILLTVLSSCGPILPINNPFEEGTLSDRETSSKPLRIVILDVGQGDAALVLGPNGANLLIDGGPPGAGESIVGPALEGSLDWIVATHYDADHIGGIPEVLRGPDQELGTDDDLVPESGLLDRGDFTDKSTPFYEATIEAAGPYRHEATPGMMLDLGAGVTAEVIVVNGRYADGRTIHLNPDEENEASIGLLIRHKEFTYFTAGDLPGGGTPGGFETKDMETIAGEIIGDIDVLHVGHHGSASSSNEGFLEETRPEIVIISVGDNDYGHPAPSTLQRLESIGATIYRTDRVGTIEIQTDGDHYEIMDYH